MTIKTYTNVPPVTPALRVEMLERVIDVLGQENMPWIIVSPAPVRQHWKNAVTTLGDRVPAIAVHYMTMRAVRTGPLTSRAAILVDDIYPDQKPEFRKLVERLQKSTLGMRVFTMFPTPPTVEPNDKESVDAVRQLLDQLKPVV